ncbi:PAP2 superfamily-domain-containing protein [Xylaria arbuscula]|nr:PAP2 superfamily-domain-containing protein [Xylaria arbuscula]
MDQQVPNPNLPDPGQPSQATTAVNNSVAPSTAGTEAPPKMSSACSTRDPYSIEKRPSFGQWVKLAWLDILTVCVVGAFALPVYFLVNPIGIRMFPLDDRVNDNGTITSSSTTSLIPTDLAYPRRGRMVSNWLIAVIAIIFPAFIITLMQFWIRNFWDLNNALLGFAYSLLMSAAFQGTVKAFIGGLRPTFYDTCRPDSAYAKKNNNTRLNGIGFRGDMWTRDVCTNTDKDQMRDAMQGFPSGHSTTMVAAMVYLCLYLNAKLKVFANYHTPLWKLVALAIPILGAVLLCGSLIVDNSHSWYDIVAGAAIGIAVSFAAFRMVYPSIFDWRINHIPLNRNTPFDGQSRQDLVATTRAGWWSPAFENDGATTPGSSVRERNEGENRAGHSTPNRPPDLYLGLDAASRGGATRD